MAFLRAKLAVNPGRPGSLSVGSTIIGSGAAELPSNWWDWNPGLLSIDTACDFAFFMAGMCAPPLLVVDDDGGDV